MIVSADDPAAFVPSGEGAENLTYLMAKQPYCPSKTRFFVGFRLHSLSVVVVAVEPSYPTDPSSSLAVEIVRI